jgi:hypothetical protein
MCTYVYLESYSILKSALQASAFDRANVKRGLAYKLFCEKLEKNEDLKNRVTPEDVQLMERLFHPNLFPQGTLAVRCFFVPSPQFTD